VLARSLVDVLGELRLLDDALDDARVLAKVCLRRVNTYIY
jgi:hypothetical protein